MGSDDLVARLEPHPRVADAASVMYRAGDIRALFAALALRDKEIERLTADEARLRKSLAECAAHTGGHADGATVDFLMHVPENVRLHVERLTKERDERNKLAIERAAKAASAEALAATATRERDEARAECERKDAALRAIDDYWTAEFPNGPDGDCPVMFGLGQMADDTKAIWRTIRAALTQQPSEVQP